MALLLKPSKSNSGNTKAYPLAPIRDGVIFPHVEVVLTFGRSKSVHAINESFSTNKLIVFVTQRKATTAEPQAQDLYSVGVLARIERTLKTNGEINALVKGLHRVKIEKIETHGQFLTATVTEIPEIVAKNDSEVEALAKHLLGEFKKAVNLGKSVEFLNFMKLMSGVEANELADQISATLDINTQEKQTLLELPELRSRLSKIIEHISHETKVLEIERSIASKTQKKFDKHMRENVLRERLKTIQSELGEMDEEGQEADDIKKKIKNAKLPLVVRKKVEKELVRFNRMSIHSPEYSYLHTWLETILDLPWSVSGNSQTKHRDAEKLLDAEHYGLEEVKDRVLEYLAVLQLKKNQKTSKNRSVPTILCFVGPPGVGKTSIGKGIAKALGRKFSKISLGGIRDEAEIRGHRRTYVGAMPGRIIQGIRQAGTNNPVFMLDEIDKIGIDFRGDPSAALLEALDPEQNTEFSDHYLEVPFDLSQVIFITTANVLDTIPPALRDRLEIIEFSGYTQEEKYQIAKRHLYDKTLAANGLTPDQVKITPEAIKIVVRDYTREAGVRNLEREISKIMRKAARKIANGKEKTVTVNPAHVSGYLGPRKFTPSLAEKEKAVGLATGLAWTEVGGDIIFIEVAVMPGQGRIVLTGKLGDVMQESAKAAWSYVRSRWENLGLKRDFYKTIDVHVHVPEGAVPKDGPSAGITMATAMISALTQKPTSTDLGMTGEITLRGRVLEIGGVKEKVIAGRRAGLKTIILPKNNKKDLVKIPDEVRKTIKFHFVDHMDQVRHFAFGNGIAPKKLSTSTKTPPATRSKVSVA